MSGILDWLVLARAHGIKNETLRFAIDQYGYDPTLLKEKIIEHSKNAGCFEKISFATIESAQQELENTTKYGGKIISIFDDNYPSILRETYNAPLVLSIKGDPIHLLRDGIGIVGSRKPLFHSQELAIELSHDIAKNGFNVISGMATGIDSSAHFGALKTGSTIAVLGTGINCVYPAENQKLYDEICENGVVVSQYPFNTSPRPGNFPVRNQVIAGLSICVVVVEAYRKSDTGRSGSLITAEFAYNLGRKVYTVPGFPTKDGRFSGNNYLIKEQIATLIENANDILANIKPRDEVVREGIKVIKPSDIKIEDLGQIKFQILSVLGSVPMSINQICIATNLSIDIIRAAVIELELGELIIRGYDNKITKLNNF